MMMYEVADLVDDLVEIVKQGGVSDDVCEWKYSSLTGNLDSDRHKKVIKDAIACEWKFCPYCGKKITVVEYMDES